MDSKVAAPLENERGMALISIMLMIVLMTSLLMMALNISSIEINLASTNRRTTQGLHAGAGGADLVMPVIRETLALNAIPTYPTASKVVVNPLNTAGGLSAPDFVREMTSGSSPTGGLLDNPENNPNVTITALSDQTIQVDVDNEGPVSRTGSELEEQNIGYHRKSAGTGCPTPTAYYINSLAIGPMKTETGTSLVYLHCS